MPFFKKIEKFKVIATLATQSDVPFKHDVEKIQKIPPACEFNPLRQKYQNIWYAKKCDDFAEALCELLAQEFLRLFYPLQPKTRLALSKRGEIYVLSKEIPGFTPLDFDKEAFKNSVTARHHKGLGIILVLALLIQEIDLKNGNVGQDHKLNILKIDGDNCFINIFKKRANVFGTEDIEHLPFIKDYYSYNWFDLVRQGKNRKFSRLFASGFENIPALRQEINETILSVLLLSDEHIKTFVNFYTDAIPSLAERISNELFAAKNMLLTAALQSPSFQKYFHESNLTSFIATLSKRLQNFVNINSVQVFILDNMQQDMIAALIQLQRLISPQQNTDDIPQPSTVVSNKSECFIQEVFMLSKTMNKKALAQEYLMTETALGTHLYKYYNTTYTQLKNMTEKQFNRRFQRFLKNTNSSTQQINSFLQQPSTNTLCIDDNEKYVESPTTVIKNQNTYRENAKFKPPSKSYQSPQLKDWSFLNQENKADTEIKPNQQHPEENNIGFCLIV